MFFFGKKKKEKKQEQAVPVANKEELIAKASEKVTELESKTGDERVSLLNENRIPVYTSRRNRSGNQIL